jgi:hypothetical protein
MKITAILETWHFYDGNYSELNKGQLVNLSFEMGARKLEAVDLNTPNSLVHQGGGKYSFCGDGLRFYNYHSLLPLIVIQTGAFSFYTISAPKGVGAFRPGTKVAGEGMLQFDTYYWVENLDNYENPPQLFYNLEVKRIRKVQIPEKLLKRYDSGESYPASLLPGEYSADCVESVNETTWQPHHQQHCFYVVDFDGTGLEEHHIPRTFYLP